MAKVSIIGAGSVGATTAQRLAEKNLADIILLDIVEGLPQGKALDIAHSSYVLNFNSTVTGTNNYRDTQGSDIVIITSGASRKPGMTRDQLTGINAGIIKEVVTHVTCSSPDAIILMVTNPVDAMTYLALKQSAFESRKVIGLSGVLDSARMAYLISKELKVPVTDVNAYVFGEHGQNMVIIPRLNSVRGTPLNKMLPKSVISGIVENTIGAGSEVVSLLKTSSAYYAPSAAAASMTEAILTDSQEIMPCAVYLNGEYGLKDIVFGVPVRLGKNGVESIIQLELTKLEQKQLAASAKAVKELIKSTASA